MKDPGLLEQTRSGESGEREAGGVTRRGFFKGAGSAAAITALSSPLVEAVETAATPAFVGPDAVKISLTINGKKQELTIEPRVTLLDALRNHLDTTGAKKVCDRGTCGACTVTIDGKPAYSCSVLAIDAQGRQIKTIEGLGADHPLVAAFANNDAQQCGFCTPGFVVACSAFLDKHPKATREDVEKGLGGNLCRCGTYVGIKAAVVEAAMKGGRNA